MIGDRWFTDHPPSTRWPHYTRANAGEVLPTPASPLGQTFAFDAAILQGFQVGSCRTGMYELGEWRAGTPEMCGFFGGYFYINLSCIRMQAVRNPAITIEQLDLAFFGENPATPAHDPHPDDEKPHLAPAADAHMAFVVSATEWPELIDERRLAASIRDDRPDLATMSDADLLVRARELQSTIRDLAVHHIVASSSSGIAPGMLAAVAEALHDPTIPMRVLAGLGDVDSAAPSFAVWELSRRVRSSAALGALFDAGVDSVIPGLRADPSDEARELLAGIESFLHDFGSRGPNEWELSAPTWETDPTIALAAVDRVRFQPDEKSPAARGAVLAVEREAVTAEVRAALDTLGDDQVSATFEAAVVAGNMMIFRERAKTTLVRVLHETRMIFCELGRRHAASGDLADAAHIFMLTDDELDAFVAAPSTSRERLAGRAADWATLWSLEPPFFIENGDVPSLERWPAREPSGATPIEPGEVLTGVAGSPGRVTGRARIVTDPADPPDLLPGDIMIAPLTDPAWTPLFMAVDAVVVNVGGQISHAVIVCRELGLPCVVSVADATDRIPDGASIEVDGENGTVRLVSMP